jgi:hypothetical protein
MKGLLIFAIPVLSIRQESTYQQDSIYQERYNSQPTFESSKQLQQQGQEQ